MVIKTCELKKSGLVFESSMIQKYSIRFYKTCPICQAKISFKIEQKFFENASHYPFPHVFLHGNPIHALIAYVDKDHKVRGFESVKSVQLHRDSTTFTQLLQKWSDPF